MINKTTAGIILLIIAAAIFIYFNRKNAAVQNVFNTILLGSRMFGAKPCCSGCAGGGGCHDDERRVNGDSIGTMNFRSMDVFSR